MKLKVIRKIFTEKSTIGDLLIDNIFFCYTLEDKVREIPNKPVSEWKKIRETAIPYGIYKLILDLSTRFKKIMPHILNVPGFEGVRIHSGNTSLDTEGCLLVGSTKSADFVGNSKTTFTALFTKLETAFNNKEEITIEYVKEGTENKPEKEIKKEELKPTPEITVPIQNPEIPKIIVHETTTAQTTQTAQTSQTVQPAQETQAEKQSTLLTVLNLLLSLFKSKKVVSK
jgi:hypothetical protein